MGAFARWRSSAGLVIALAIGTAAWGVAPASAVITSPAATIKPAITSGRLHSCALRSAGTVVCWGDNGNGELGDGTIANSPRPVQVAGVNGVGFLTL